MKFIYHKGTSWSFTRNSGTSKQCKSLIYFLNFVCCALFVSRGRYLSKEEKNGEGKRGKHLEKGNIFPQRKKTEKAKEDNIWSREDKKNGTRERGKYHPRSPLPILPVKCLNPTQSTSNRIKLKTWIFVESWGSLFEGSCQKLLQKWPKSVQKCPRVVQIHISSVFDRYSSFGSLLDRFGHFWRKKTG